ncbi:DNA-directed RNA polymerase [archaeon]|jgi:DNA-directed RNA polymerase subunit E'|nr:DNA-directed RNA polymerase [archaeon]MBT6824333.1 DNA-directed RNA polymerase [archaeon]MBT7106883.1 DNA-directed RNA polymerase [archaeon]MBT7297435.1 DNA-directed RNA polymerase [archaeon]
MFYEIKIKEHIRVAPTQFGDDIKESVINSLNDSFNGYVSEDLGFVIGISNIDKIGEGKILPEDGGVYYETTFSVFTFKPELQEIVVGRISEITNFGAFLEIGPVEGMIHIGQTMDDYVSFSKENVLLGKESKKTVKVNDICRARIIAISYKDITNPKIGITMRQPWLGNVNWIKEDLEKVQARKEEK